MTDIEDRSDRNIESAASHAQGSSRHLWIAAYQSAKVYGRHEEHATKEIARRAGRSVAAVQSWVDAYRAFILCYEADKKLARNLRRTLTLTHFRRIYNLHVRYSLTADQCLYFLSLMAVARESGECYGPDAMEQEIDTDLRYAGIKPDEPVNWNYWWTRAYTPLKMLASFNGELPDDIKRRVLELLALFDERYNDVV